MMILNKDEIDDRCNYSSIVERIEYVLSNRNMSVWQLSDTLCLTKGNLETLLYSRKKMKIVSLINIANALQVNIDFFLYGKSVNIKAEQKQMEEDGSEKLDLIYNKLNILNEKNRLSARALGNEIGENEETIYTLFFKKLNMRASVFGKICNFYNISPDLIIHGHKRYSTKFESKDNRLTYGQIEEEVNRQLKKVDFRLESITQEKGITYDDIYRLTGRRVIIEGKKNVKNSLCARDMIEISIKAGLSLEYICSGTSSGLQADIKTTYNDVISFIKYCADRGNYFHGIYRKESIVKFLDGKDRGMGSLKDLMIISRVLDIGIDKMVCLKLN